MKQELLPEQNLEQEIEKIFSQVQGILQQLDQVKQNLVRQRIGNDTYNNARTLLQGSENPDQELREQLYALDRAENIETVRSLLNLGANTEEQRRQMVVVETIVEDFYPDETTLSLLDDEEKLAAIGAKLKITFGPHDLYDNPDVESYNEANQQVDAEICAIYKELTGVDSIEAIYCDELSFDIDLHDSFFNEDHDRIMDDDSTTMGQKMYQISKQSKASVAVSITQDQLRLNSDTITQRAQIDEIENAILPLVNVIEILEQDQASV